MRNELRQLVAKLRQSKSAKITSEARKRRYQRQTKEALEPAELDRREDIIAKSFQLWSFGDETIPQYKVCVLVELNTVLYTQLFTLYMCTHVLCLVCSISLDESELSSLLSTGFDARKLTLFVHDNAVC